MLNTNAATTTSDSPQSAICFLSLYFSRTSSLVVPFFLEKWMIHRYIGQWKYGITLVQLQQFQPFILSLCIVCFLSKDLTWLLLCVKWLRFDLFNFSAMPVKIFSSELFFCSFLLKTLNLESSWWNRHKFGIHLNSDTPSVEKGFHTSMALGEWSGGWWAFF